MQRDNVIIKTARMAKIENAALRGTVEVVVVRPMPVGLRSVG